MATDDNDALREEIKTGLARTGLDATNLSKQIGRSKDYIREFLNGRKRSIAQDAATKIRSLFSQRSVSVSNDCKDDYISVGRSLLRQAIEFVLLNEGVEKDRASILAEILPEALEGVPVDAVEKDPFLSFQVHFQLEAQRSERRVHG